MTNKPTKTMGWLVPNTTIKTPIACRAGVTTGTQICPLYDSPYRKGVYKATRAQRGPVEWHQTLSGFLEEINGTTKPICLPRQPGMQGSDGSSSPKIYAWPTGHKKTFKLEGKTKLDSLSNFLRGQQVPQLAMVPKSTHSIWQKQTTLKSTSMWQH